MPNVAKLYRDNWKLAKTPEFSKRMLHALLVQDVRILRIHVAGDFFDAAYAAKWLTIVRRARRTTFVFYTRSWQDPKILPYLLELAREKNVRAWFSWDRSMPYPPRTKDTRIAYMSVGDEDMPTKHVHLIFRTDRRSVMKRNKDGILVCPSEQGITRTVKLTCDRCKLCVLPKSATRKLLAAKATASATTGRFGRGGYGTGRRVAAVAASIG